MNLSTLLRVAWRNLWRNPRRTLITAFAMAFGMAMMVFTVALMQGFMAQMERYATILGPGHIQLHHPKYLEEHSLYDSIPGGPAVAVVAEKALSPEGKGGARPAQAAGQGEWAAPRVFATGLVSSGPRSAGAMLWGVDPVREERVTELFRHLSKGEWLAPQAGQQVILGAGLALTLGVGPGDEVVLLTQAADGSLGNALFRVAGILLPLGEAMDRGGVLMHIGDLDALAAMEGKVHEIVVRLGDPSRLEEAAGALSGAAGPLAGLSVQTWKQANPEIAETLALYDVSQFITLLIIFSAAALVIMDSQLMAIFERTGEFGVLRALGMGPGRVAALVLLETLLLSAIALAGGVAGGALVSAPLRQGLDLSGMAGSFSFNGVVFTPVIQVDLRWSSFVQPARVLLLVALLAMIYPVIRAVRITPMAAIREQGK